MIQTNEFLSVKETVEKTGLSEHTLRYYEKIGLLAPVGRTRAGHRCYSEADLGWIGFLKCLRATGMSIESMKSFMAFQREGDDCFSRRVHLLESHRLEVVEKIEELKRYLGTIDYYSKESKKHETKDRKN